MKRLNRTTTVMEKPCVQYGNIPRERMLARCYRTAVAPTKRQQTLFTVQVDNGACMLMDEDVPPLTVAAIEVTIRHTPAFHTI